MVEREHRAGPRHEARDGGGMSVAGVAVAVGVGVGAGALLAAGAARRRRQAERAREYADAAPPWTRRAGALEERAPAVNVATINRKRAELFAYWRDFANLATFMENVREVRPLDGGRWEWRIAAPGGGTVRLETEITEEQADELIAWRSLPGSDVDASGSVRFRDAQGGRGTIVEARVDYRPPFGEVGRVVAKLMQREPQVQGRRELRRFKMLMETGEIATAANRRSTQEGE